jgi:hypothetical protein
MTTSAFPRPRVLLAVPAALLLTLLLATPAGAHGAAGKMTVLRAEQKAPTTAEIEVGLLYANDSEVAEEATVTVTAISPTGGIAGPVTAVRESSSSRYLATVELTALGTWSFTVNAANPAAQVTGSVEMAPPATTTTAAPVTTAVPVTTAAPAPVINPAPAPPAEPDSGGLSGGALAGVIVALVVVGVLALGARARSRGAGGGDGTAGDPDEAPTPTAGDAAGSGADEPDDAVTEPAAHPR